MVLSFYRTLMRLSGPFLHLLLLLRRLQGLEEKGHVLEKTGRATLPRPAGKIVWIHAASNGEMLSSLPLVHKILSTNSDTTCLITTVTVTAARLARRQNSARIIHQYAPLDHPVWIDRFIDHWNPDAVLWVESELWPTTLGELHDRNIPLAMINGRLSDRSARRWGKLPQTIHTVLSWFDVALAQTAGDAARLQSLGANALQAGNIKYAAAPLTVDGDQFKALQAQIGTRPTLLLASTHAGEEEIAAQVYQTLSIQYPHLLVIIMPRHPRRSDDIMDMLAQRKLSVARRSVGDTITPDKQIYLADTLGEAGLFYQLCPIAYVGNSLITDPGGGHNLLEPAHMDCAILHGPHMWNFSEIERDLREAGGSITVRDADDLAAQTATLLQNPAQRQALADAALAFVQAQDRVLDDVAGHLRPLMNKAGISL